MINELAQLIGGSRWLMEPRAMRAMLTRVAATSSHEIDASRVAYAGMAERAMQPTLMGDVAVINMTGPIVYKMSWFSMLFGCSSIEALQQQHRAALADPAVRTIVYRCDSPGGDVVMVPEFADEIFASRGIKPMIAVADTMICSAAFWAMAQCDQIYASRSSMLGCVGTYTEHEDISAMLEKLGVKITLIAHPAEKVEGNAYEPLSEAARAHYQAYADEVGVEFEAALVRGRGVPKATVIEWTKIGVIPPRGKRAIALGLADKIGTFDSVMAKLTSKGRGGRSMAAVAANAAQLKANLTEGKAAIAATAASASGMKADMVDPEDGECPEGYEMGEDDMCHLMPDDDAAAKAAAELDAAQAAADQDALAIMAALSE